MSSPVSADGTWAKGLGWSGWPEANEDKGIFLNPMLHGVELDPGGMRWPRFENGLAGRKNSLAEKHQRVSRMDEEEIKPNPLTIGARQHLSVAVMKPQHRWEDERQGKQGGGQGDCIDGQLVVALCND